MITYDILFSNGQVAYGVASNIAAAARRAMRIAQREGIRVVSVTDRYAPRPADTRPDAQTDR